MSHLIDMSDDTPDRDKGQPRYHDVTIPAVQHKIRLHMNAGQRWASGEAEVDLLMWEDEYKRGGDGVREAE